MTDEQHARQGAEQQRAPTNRRSRAERVASWNAATREGQRFRPRRLDGDKARYRWVQVVMRSDLAATTRLVGHTLVTHGKSDGSGIFPSTRRLAEESGLSERAVCSHLDTLVRRGFLLRVSRKGDTAGARGFEYRLTEPEVLKEDQHHGRGRQRAALTDVQHQPPVLKDDQHSAERYANSAEPDDSSVLKDVQPSDPGVIHRVASAARANGAAHTEDGRPRPGRAVE